ncbi:MAG: hypothetical protein ACREJU_17760 [Nitrospiraceae bacterium]
MATIYCILCILRRYAVVMVLTALPIALGGCSAGLGLWPVVQSHVTASGAKLVLIGESEGTAGDFFFTWGGLPDFLHPDLQEEAVRKAVRAKGGDLLINYTLSVRATRLPLGLFLTELNAWWVTWTAEGIAVKVQPVNHESTRQRRAPADLIGMP